MLGGGARAWAPATCTPYCAAPLVPWAVARCYCARCYWYGMGPRRKHNGNSIIRTLLLYNSKTRYSPHVSPRPMVRSRKGVRYWKPRVEMQPAPKPTRMAPPGVCQRTVIQRKAAVSCLRGC